jgi:hypothetical protein
LNGLFWMYADLPVAYDPCTCNNFTAISVLPNFINVQQVNLLTATVNNNLINAGTSSPNFGTSISHSLDYFNKTATNVTK